MANVRFKETISQPSRALTWGPIQLIAQDIGGILRVDGDDGTIDIYLDQDELKQVAISINTRYALLDKRKRDGVSHGGPALKHSVKKLDDLDDPGAA